jgi:hypothetical protein
MTTVASAAMAQAGRLMATFASKPLGAQQRRLEVQAPAGPSTQAGRAARQALLLSTRDQSPVIGWVDFAAKQAEVKTWQHVREAHQARYGTTFDVSREDYAAFLLELDAALRGLEVRLTTDAVESLDVTDKVDAFGPQRRSSSVVPRAWPLIMGALLLVGVVTSVLFSLRR